MNRRLRIAYDYLFAVLTDASVQPFTRPDSLTPRA